MDLSASKVRVFVWKIAYPEVAGSNFELSIQAPGICDLELILESIKNGLPDHHRTHIELLACEKDIHCLLS